LNDSFFLAFGNNSDNISFTKKLHGEENMGVFDLLLKNKGTVSSALSKKLGLSVLDGDIAVLREAIKYCTYNLEDVKSKNIRAAAGKIVEVVAQKKPELVAPHLEKLLGALTAREPQTRWIIIRTMGLCARLNEKTAEKAIPFAKRYIEVKEGLCLSSSADLFLADFGSISKKNAKKVFPILEQSISNYVYNEQDWILEACAKIAGNLGEKEKAVILAFAKKWENSSRKATQNRAKKILKTL
jgi:hypothetical protein